MAKKYRGSSIKRDNIIEMYGVSDLLNKIENAGGRVDEAIKRCVEESLKQVGLSMNLFMIEHKETGDTMSSYEEIINEIKNNKITGYSGYNVKKGGLPAIFLDVGTPSQTPYFFRYYAVENNRQKIREIQEATLNEILEGLK